MRPEPFRRTVWPLAIAEVFVWASMFYSFPALLLEWERDLGWSKTELSGAFTLALAVSALLAPVAGRLIDHGLGRYVLTGSALLGASVLALLSMVSKWSMLDVMLVALVLFAAKTSGLAAAAILPGLWFYAAATLSTAFAASLCTRSSRL